MIVELGEPRVLSQAPADVRDWGPWQFPRTHEAGPDLYLEFHVEADSAKAYGRPKAWLVSHDRGASWEESEPGGILLPNGDLIRPVQRPSISVEEADLPEPVGGFSNYGFVRKVYDYGAVKPEYRTWQIARKRPGDAWKTEEVEVDFPDHVMYTSEGVFPMCFFLHFIIGPDDSVWTLPYRHYLSNGVISRYCADAYLKSTDCAKSFRLVSRVPYAYDIDRDPAADKRYGFGEPDICFLDRKNAFSLHRTTDGTGIGPLYITWTHDGCATWSSPEYFDDRGVYPQTVALDNGVVLAGYGRTGLFVRPYGDGEWGERVAIVEPGEYQTETCSYCSLVARDEQTALIFYSDFNVPGPDGTKRKSIMMREINTAL